jgi:hypothetical protein
VSYQSKLATGGLFLVARRTDLRENGAAACTGGIEGGACGIRPQGVLVLLRTINLGGGGRGSANFASVYSRCVWWSGLAVNHRAIYSRGGPAITSRPRIASQAHADHVGRRHSERDHDMSATAARFTGHGGRRWGLRLDSGNGATYALSNSGVIRSLPSPNWNVGGTNRGGKSPAGNGWESPWCRYCTMVFFIQCFWQSD